MNAAVIVAAGRGTRMGLERNKVLAPLCGEPVIARTVRVFERTGWFDGGIVVVTGACDLCEMKQILADAGLHAQVVLGGADRQESVCRGLAAVNPKADYIAIHDGARPLISTEDIDRVLTDAVNYGASIAAAPVTDTIKICAGNLVDSTPDRDTLYAAQTPQAFRRELYLSCVDRLGTRAESLTDDSALLEACGEEVHITAVTACNMKVTRPQDLAIAAAVLRR